MRKQTPETALTANVMNLLRLSGYSVKKIYNGGTVARIDRSLGKVIYKKKDEESRGIPDLIAYNKDSFFFIEVKRPDGKVKPEQKEFIDAFNNCQTFEAIVVRDVLELQKKLRNRST